MSLDACDKCWDSPCSCGWDWRHYSIEYTQKTIKVLEAVVSYKKCYPKVEFKRDFIAKTNEDKKIEEDFMSYVRERSKR